MSIPSHSDFQPIEAIDALDLSRHALMEASAGTGKTYTIENLVVRLLKEEAELNLENILLVTFTEKATGELKQRIRLKIEQTLDGEEGLSDRVREKLGDTLDGFDNAAISTIHGFCHTLLKEYPFETGNLFRQELIDDGPLLEGLLRTQMRQDWPLRYGRRLPLLLDLVDFSADVDGFFFTVIRLVRQLSQNPGRGTLIPDPAELDLEDLWQALTTTVLSLKALAEDPPGLVQGYGRLNINKRSRSAVIRDLMQPLQQLLARVSSDDLQLVAFKPMVAYLKARHSSGGRNIDRLVPTKWLKAGNNLHACPNLTAVRDRLAELVRLFARLAHLLMLTAVDQLRHEASVTKARRGWISYQDMLNRVADFLTGVWAEDGLRRIRQRYRVAFVDEFQDTDEVQWRIFKTLYLDPDAADAGNRLFLIGDPKQAIYAFRGADVFTYLDARQCMKNLANRKMANLYELRINWRSAPPLVAAFNQLFGQETWFGTNDRQGPFDIGYTASLSPATDRLPIRIRTDHSRRPPLNVMDLTAATDHAGAKDMMADFICREIHYLMLHAGIRLVDDHDRPRPLQFKDIAILVRSQSEFARIEPMLVASSIPYTYYRKPGLFQSREARWLSLILRAISNPQRMPSVKLALLTPFFDISPRCLQTEPDLPQGHAGLQLLVRWHNLAMQRRWGPLFQSLMEHSGLMLRHCMDPDWERTQTNFLQLFDYLEGTVHTQRLDAAGLGARLESLRRSGSGLGIDDDIHQIEDEGDKVQILTMHVSKGLEFPVVFIAGGLTVRNGDRIHVYHRLDAGHPDRPYQKVLDLTEDTGRDLAQKEIEDENKRIYYVALTRSQLKLYIPFYPDNRNYSWLGPVCRFVSTSIKRAFMDHDDPMQHCGWHAVGTTDQKHLKAITPNGQRRTPTVNLSAGQWLPVQTDFRQRKLGLESFSSIAHRIGELPALDGQATAFSLSNTFSRDADEPSDDPAAVPPGPETADWLPGGRRMGSLFHYIFEHIHFRQVAHGPEDILDMKDVQAMIAAAMDLHRIERRWTGLVANVVATTLRMPIDLDGATLVLGKLGRRQRRHELEFYFPLDHDPSGPMPVPGCHLSANGCGRTLIRGFIDLVFAWNDRYYLADWKSNRLRNGYHQAAMMGEIQAAGYELQYQLYAVATLRWLKQRLGHSFDPRQHFGGALYVFIRGADSGAKQAVFHVPPEQLLPVESLQASIQQKLGKRSQATASVLLPDT